MLGQRASLLLLLLQTLSQGQQQNGTREDGGHVTLDASIHFPRGQEDCESDSDCGLTLACIEVLKETQLWIKTYYMPMSCLETVFRPMSSTGRESLSNGGGDLQGESTFLLSPESQQ